jgi:hypothetical protein
LAYSLLFFYGLNRLYGKLKRKLLRVEAIENVEAHRIIVIRREMRLKTVILKEDA